VKADRSKNLGAFLHPKKSPHTAKPKVFADKPGHAPKMNPHIKHPMGMAIRKPK